MFYHVFSTKINPGGVSIHRINELALLKPSLVIFLVSSEFMIGIFELFFFFSPEPVVLATLKVESL